MSPKAARTILQFNTILLLLNGLAPPGLEIERVDRNKPSALRYGLVEYLLMRGMRNVQLCIDLNKFDQV
jgi:hypothetical protein